MVSVKNAGIMPSKDVCFMQEEKDLNSDTETKEIVDDITQGTGLIAIASLIIAMIYFYIYSSQNNTKTERIIETSTMAPLFVLICTAVEGAHIMFAEFRKKKYKAEGVTKAVEMFKQAGVDDKTVNQVIELARASGITIKQSNSHSSGTTKSNNPK